MPKTRWEATVKDVQGHPGHAVGDVLMLEGAKSDELGRARAILKAFDEPLRRRLDSPRRASAPK
jgi:hypothetical protein